MLDRITSRAAVLSALATAVVMLTAATRGPAAPLANVAPLATKDTAAVKTATLQVKNEALADRVVYVTMDGTRQRLGTADGASTTYFTIPRSFVSAVNTVRFLAHPRFGNTHEESQQMQLFPGDTVDMTIQGQG